MFEKRRAKYELLLPQHTIATPHLQGAAQAAPRQANGCAEPLSRRMQLLDGCFVYDQ
jgi:hypothetical protein